MTLKPGEKIEDIAKRLGAKIVGRSDGQNTYRLRFDDDKSADTARTTLQSDSSVESVDNNYYVSRPETMQPLGLPGGPIPLIPKASPDGKYIVVGLIDSAIQSKEGGLSQFLLPGITVDEAQRVAGPYTPQRWARRLCGPLASSSAEKSTTCAAAAGKCFWRGRQKQRPLMTSQSGFIKR